MPEKIGGGDLNRSFQKMVCIPSSSLIIQSGGREVTHNQSLKRTPRVGRKISLIMSLGYARMIEARFAAPLSSKPLAGFKILTEMNTSTYRRFSPSMTISGIVTLGKCLHPNNSSRYRYYSFEVFTVKSTTQITRRSRP